MATENDSDTNSKFISAILVIAKISLNPLQGFDALKRRPEIICKRGPTF